MQSTICWLQHVSTQFKNVGQIGSSLQAEVTFLTCLEVKPPFNIFWSAFPHVHHYHSPWFSLHLFFDSSPSLCPIHHDMKGIVPHKTAKTAMMELGVLRFLDSFLGQKMIIHLVCLHLPLLTGSVWRFFKGQSTEKSCETSWHLIAWKAVVCQHEPFPLFSIVQVNVTNGNKQATWKGAIGNWAIFWLAKHFIYPLSSTAWECEAWLSMSWMEKLES